MKEGDEIIAKISGLITKPKPLLGRDMLFYAYPALQNEDGELLNKSLWALLDFVRSKGCMRLIVASYDQQFSLEANVKGLYSNSRCEYVVNLRPEHGDIKFSQNLKRNVKKAEKNGAILERRTACWRTAFMNCLTALLRNANPSMEQNTTLIIYPGLGSRPS